MRLDGARTRLFEMGSEPWTLRKTLGEGSTGLDCVPDPALQVEQPMGDWPQEEQTEIKQSGPYSCIVLAVLEIERQGEAAVSAFIPGRV